MPHQLQKIHFRIKKSPLTFSERLTREKKKKKQPRVKSHWNFLTIRTEQPRFKSSSIVVCHKAAGQRQLADAANGAQWVRSTKSDTKLTSLYICYYLHVTSVGTFRGLWLIRKPNFKSGGVNKRSVASVRKARAVVDISAPDQIMFLPLFLCDPSVPELMFFKVLKRNGVDVCPKF